MAIGATCAWEVRSTGNDANGGFFDPVSGTPGTDRSQQDSPHVTIDGSTITATVFSSTDQVTITGYTVAAADVGNAFNINGGTATAGRYRITAVDTGNNRWTLDRSAGTNGQTATGRMGGCLATPATAFGAMASGNDCWIKSATYNHTAVLTPPGPSTNDPSVISGYGTTRGDGGRATLRVTSATADVIRINGGNVLRDLIIDGNNQTSQRGIQCNVIAGLICHRVKVQNCTNYGIFSENDNYLIDCEFVNCTGIGCWMNFGTVAVCCVATGNTGAGFLVASYSVLLNTVSADNGGVGFETGINPTNIRYFNCVAYSNSGDAWPLNIGPSFHIWVNCIAYGNGGWGWSQSGSSAQFSANAMMISCAGGGNTSGNRMATPALVDLNFISLSADPFVDGANGDFDLNGTSGGGAALKGQGYPGIPTGTMSSSRGYADVGAFQSQGGVTIAGKRRKRVM